MKKFWFIIFSLEQGEWFNSGEEHQRLLHTRLSTLPSLYISTSIGATHLQHSHWHNAERNSHFIQLYKHHHCNPCFPVKFLPVKSMHFLCVTSTSTRTKHVSNVVKTRRDDTAIFSTFVFHVHIFYSELYSTSIPSNTCQDILYKRPTIPSNRVFL